MILCFLYYIIVYFPILCDRKFNYAILYYTMLYYIIRLCCSILILIYFDFLVLSYLRVSLGFGERSLLAHGRISPAELHHIVLPVVLSHHPKQKAKHNLSSPLKSAGSYKVSRGF